MPIRGARPTAPSGGPAPISPDVSSRIGQSDVDLTELERSWTFDDVETPPEQG